MNNANVDDKKTYQALIGKKYDELNNDQETELLTIGQNELILCYRDGKIAYAAEHPKSYKIICDSLTASKQIEGQVVSFTHKVQELIPELQGNEEVEKHLKDLKNQSASMQHPSNTNFKARMQHRFYKKKKTGNVGLAEKSPNNRRILESKGAPRDFIKKYFQQNNQQQNEELVKIIFNALSVDYLPHLITFIKQHPNLEELRIDTLCNANRELIYKEDIKPLLEAISVSDITTCAINFGANIIKNSDEVVVDHQRIEEELQKIVTSHVQLLQNEIQIKILQNQLNREELSEIGDKVIGYILNEDNAEIENVGQIEEGLLTYGDLCKKLPALKEEFKNNSQLQDDRYFEILELYLEKNNGEVTEQSLQLDEILHFLRDDAIKQIILKAPLFAVHRKEIHDRDEKLAQSYQYTQRGDNIESDTIVVDSSEKLCEVAVICALQEELSRTPNTELQENGISSMGLNNDDQRER